MNNVGRDIERIRLARGLSRKMLADMLDLTSQTVLNIEHDPSYNLGTNFLRRLEGALGVSFVISIKEGHMEAGRIVFGNDEAILYIRKRYPGCSYGTRTLGKKIWEWVEERGGRIVERDKPTFWCAGPYTDETALPKTATQLEFERSLLPEYFTFLDLLGQQ